MVVWCLVWFCGAIISSHATELKLFCFSFKDFQADAVLKQLQKLHDAVKQAANSEASESKRQQFTANLLTNDDMKALETLGVTLTDVYNYHTSSISQQEFDAIQKLFKYVLAHCHFLCYPEVVCGCCFSPSGSFATHTRTFFVIYSVFRLQLAH